MNRIPRLFFQSLVCFLMLAFSLPALTAPTAKGGWVTRDVTVTVTGSDWLFINTDIIATLTSAQGKMTDRPSYIRVKNYGKMPCYFSGTGVGSTLDSKVNPGQEVREYLALYSPAGKPLRSWRTTFKFWKGPLPNETAAAAKKRIALAKAKQQAEQKRQLAAAQALQRRQPQQRTQQRLAQTNRKAQPPQRGTTTEAQRRQQQNSQRLGERQRIVQSARPTKSTQRAPRVVRPEFNRALFVAIKDGDVAEVERLLAAGAEANARWEEELKAGLYIYEGQYPLAYATWWARDTFLNQGPSPRALASIVKLLVAAGADVNAYNTKHRGNIYNLTALENLAKPPGFRNEPPPWNIYAEMVQELLKAGADPNFTSSPGNRSVLGWARIEAQQYPEWQRVVEILEKAGAKLPADEL